MLYLLDVFFEWFFEGFYELADEFQRYLIKSLMLNLDAKLHADNIIVLLNVQNYQDDVVEMLEFIQKL